MRRTLALALLVTAIGSLIVVRVSFAEEALPPAPLLWLPSQMRIVDADVTHGELLAAPLREMGFGVKVLEVDTPTSGEAFEGVWWITNEAAQRFPATRARSILSKRGRILLDGMSPLSQDVLGATALRQTRRAATMNDTFVRWDEDIPVITIDLGTDDRTLAVTADAVANGAVTNGAVTNGAVTIGAVTIGQRRSATTASRATSGPTMKVAAKTPSDTTSETTQYPALIRRGSILWSMPRLDRGAQLRRLPYLHTALRALGVEPTVERRDIELYVDPDLEYPNSPDDLAEKWRSAGVSRIYLSAWKADRISGYEYPYDQFLTAMHERGIEVYAWVGWPHVNTSFWRAHPECREIAADGSPAHIFWRENVALEIPACFDLAWNETRELLNAHRFDGVNIAELYFENPEHGPTHVWEYTPFHPVARAEFRARYGYDPNELLDPRSRRYWASDRASFDTWVNWRTAKVAELHAKLLDRARALPRIHRITLTLIDDRYSESTGVDVDHGVTLPRNIGVDSRKLLGNLDAEPHDVQIEDASELWTKDPRRYAGFARLYGEVPVAALVIDLNVVERNGALPYNITTTKARGFELGASVAAIGSSGARLALYASSTIANDDFPWLKFSLAAGSSHVEEIAPGRLSTKSSVAFSVRVIRPAHRVVIDGKTLLLPGTRSIPVPAGTHTVEVDLPSSRAAASRRPGDRG